jgi:hypothetical protein
VRAMAARRSSRCGAGPSLGSPALGQTVGRRSKTRHQRFDFRRDLRFVDEQKRSIVKKKLASEPLSARAEFQFVCSNSPQIERRTHAPSSPGRHCFGFPTSWNIVRLEKRAAIRAIHDEPEFSELFPPYVLSRNIRIEEDLVDQLFNTSEKRLARVLLLCHGEPMPACNR